MLEAGFLPDFPPAVAAEASAGQRSTATPATTPRDLRALLWSSIDNDTSRDLDQIEYAEQAPGGGARLLVGIAEVDSLVGQNSATDKYAASECTSVYTGVTTFPMLPAELSNDATSLNPDSDRLAIVIELNVLESGESSGHDIYPALVRNQAK